VGALEVMRQSHVHVEERDRVLHAARALHDAHRVPDSLDADLVDGELAGIRARLDVGDVLQIAGFHGSDFNIPS